MRRISPHIYRTALVCFVSTLLVGVVTAWRIPASIDMVFPRSALKIEDFHAREYTAHEPRIPLQYARVSESEFQAVLPSDLHGPHALEYTVDPLPRDLKRRLFAVYINNARIMDATDTGRNASFGVIVPAHVSLTAGSVVSIRTIPDDKSTPPPLGMAQVSLTEINAYRWSTAHSTIYFPGMGGGWWQLNATLLPRHPDGKPYKAHLVVGQTDLGALPMLGGEFRSFRYLVPPAATTGGDIEVSVVSEVWGNNADDARSLGVAVSRVDLSPTAQRSGVDAFPVRFLSISLIIVMIYGIASWLGFPALALSAAAGIGLTLPLLLERVYLGMWYPHLALLIAVSCLTIPLWQWVLVRWSGDTQFSPRVRALLIGIVLCSVWIKGGGILYPIMRPIDIGWHMDKVREIATTWDFAKFYAPGAFSESVMPVTEWGENRPMIPYSPFYHFASLLFLGFPWRLEVSATIFNAFLDASRVILLAVIIHRNGLNQRTAVLAGLLYAVTPVTFLLHAWGNAPTTTGFWWMLLSTVAMLLAGKQLGDRRVFFAVTLISLAAMLSYTVAAVFHVAFVTVLAVLLWIVPNRDEKPLARHVLGVTYAGLLLATVVYYGLYIPPIIERTIPYLFSLSGDTAETIGVVRAPFSEYLANFSPALRYDFVQNPYLYYGLYLPVLLVIPAFLLLWKRRTLWTFAAAWFTVAVVFMLAGYKISMVDKQLFYIVPLLTLCWAVYADRVWTKGTAGRIVVTTTVLFTLLSAVQLWIIRIDRAPILLP